MKLNKSKTIKFLKSVKGTLTAIAIVLGMVLMCSISDNNLGILLMDKISQIDLLSWIPMWLPTWLWGITYILSTAVYLIFIVFPFGLLSIVISLVHNLLPALVLGSVAYMLHLLIWAIENDK